MTDHLDLAATGNVALRIMQATVRLVNAQGVSRTTTASICTDLGLDETTFHRHFGSVNDVFVEIARFMLAAYGTAVAPTMARRRSLYESIRIAHQAFVDVLEVQHETQGALLKIRVVALGDPTLGVVAGATSSLHDDLVTNSELWLVETGRVHDVIWELPPRTLATFVSASMTGVVIDYLARRDIADARQMVDLIAFDLSHRGRRRAKQGSY